MHRPRRLLTIASNMVFGALCLAGLSTCGDSTVFVRVNVSGIPVKTARIAVRPFVDAIPYGQELFDIGASDTALVVGFKLPANTQGQFRVEVEPQDAAGLAIKACDLSYAGSASTTIVDARSTGVDVKLAVTVPPSGITKDLYAIWGSATDDVWVAGAGGQLGHWNGCYWRAVASGTSAALRGIHGFASPSKDLWAVGGDSTMSSVAIVRSTNGGAWMSDGQLSSISGQLHDVWGSSANSLWAVGGDSSSNGLILQKKMGSGWAKYTDTTLNMTNNKTAYFASIDGIDDNHVYAVGVTTDPTCAPCTGSVAGYNGTFWKRFQFDEGRARSLSQVYAERTDMIWLAGRSGFLGDWDGDMTQADIIVGLDIDLPAYDLTQGLIGFVNPAPITLFYTLADLGRPGELRRFASGSSMMVSAAGDPIDEPTTALWGPSSTDIWIVGHGGARYHYDGTAIKKYTDPL